ncbi:MULTISPECIES: protein-glutamate O-methyltransferase CheR [unclassified Pannonibacter]|uniref:CheR family methyltransferase n=1 Tax=unclassified Pannonibacter TaxID=2627228 RepID=UPI0016464FF5|nr:MULTISPECIES: CheR family methyltransferase [unclassified Pannonibacter]
MMSKAPTTHIDRLSQQTGIAPSYIQDRLGAAYGSAGAAPALQSDADLIERLVVQETSFFRHGAQWDSLRALLREGILFPPRTLQVWCAGCATGEEVWSLAFLLHSEGFGASRILGSDISPSAIAAATEGRYTRLEAMGSFRDLPEFARGLFPGRSGETWSAPDALRSMVHFQIHNLLDPVPAAWRTRPADLVFCRNLLIYFTETAASKALSQLAGAMRKGAVLVLGAAETMRRTDLFEPVETPGAVFWRRTEAQARPLA